MDSKPKYHIPSMVEINQTPYNGFKVVSLFSGCGGSSLGYRMAGYEVLLASEFITAARDTYKANFPDTIVEPSDIRDLNPDDIFRQINLSPYELDILDGSPPCCAFSACGKGDKNWGKKNYYSEGIRQRTDDLFLEYIRILKGIKPKIFVAENVAGLSRGKAKTFFTDILSLLELSGYNVDYRLLNASNYGVPQNRLRLFIIGVRKDIDKQPIFPAPLPYIYSLREALEDLDNYIEPETDISRFAIGREYDNITTKSDKYFNLVKPNLDKPCNTLTATHSSPSAASVVHPTEKRKFSILECKRISSFPDDFILTGNYRQQAERIGRAVPPLLTYHISKTIKDILI